MRMRSEKFEQLSEREYSDLFETKKDNSELRKRALNLALDMRKFEIELYWKRATYFWTFIGVTLTGYVAVQQLDIGDKPFWSVLIGSLGFVFSVAWYCVNRGSKQWQENWENHVDLLEDDVTGPLYKVVTGRPRFDKPWWHPKGSWLRLRNIIVGPAPFSVSKINQIVSLFVIVLWIELVIKALPSFPFNAFIDWGYAAIVGLALLATLTILFLGRTDRENYRNLTATKRKTTIESKMTDGQVHENR